jgi:hypothetical protein
LQYDVLSITLGKGGLPEYVLFEDVY